MKAKKTTDQKRAYQKAYRLRNAESIKAYGKKYLARYRAERPGLGRAYCARWRADKKRRELLGREAINLIKQISNSGWNDHQAVPYFQIFVAKLLLENFDQ